MCLDMQLTSQMGQVMTDTCRVGAVGMAQRSSAAARRRSTLAAVTLFARLLLSQLAADGVSPFIVLVIVVQFIITSDRSWHTLLPLMSRIIVEALKVLGELRQHQIVHDAIASRTVQRLRLHNNIGTFEEARFDEVVAGDVLKIECDGYFPGTVLTLYVVEHGTAGSLLQVDIQNRHMHRHVFRYVFRCD